MKYLKLSSIVLLSIQLWSCASVERTWHSIVGGQNPLVGKIWSVRGKRFISQTELIHDFGDVDYILLGEKHDNRDHHELQAEIIRAIAKFGKKPKLAFEQLSPDQKNKLSSYLDLSPTSAAGLGDAVGWKQSGWPDWKIYEPVFQAGMDAKFAILPINMTTDERQRVDKSGLEGLDDNLFRDLNLNTKFSASVSALLAEEIRSAHCYKLPDEVVPRFIEMQHARDAVMAFRAEAAAKQDGAIFIVGSGHARNEWGIPAFLKRINKMAKISTLAFIEVKQEFAKPEVYVESELPYDYIWFTPASSAEDPCVKNQKELSTLPGKAQAPVKTKMTKKQKQKKASTKPNTAEQ